jgi:transposase
MGRLDDITLEELHEVREQTDGEVPRERVLAAIGRKQGDTLPRLAERHGVVEKTIRNWLDRFAEEPIEQAPYDEQRPGRPSKLEDNQRDQLFEHLQDSPTELGYEQQAWSTKLLLHHVKEAYGVEYSDGHARKLLCKAGLSYRTARPRHHEADLVPCQPLAEHLCAWGTLAWNERITDAKQTAYRRSLRRRAC